MEVELGLGVELGVGVEIELGLGVAPGWGVVPGVIATTRTRTASPAVALPARSVAVAVSSCSPAARSRPASQVQRPSSDATAPHSVPLTAEDATVTVVPGSAVPASVGRTACSSSPGPGEVISGLAGATVSTVSVAGRPGARLPAWSTELGVSKCGPSARSSTGRQDQEPS